MGMPPAPPLCSCTHTVTDNTGHITDAVFCLDSDLASPLQEYVRKLGACLVEVRADCDGDAPCPSTLQLHTWAAEATSLMVCIALRNPWAIKAFNAAVDTNTAAEEGKGGTTAQQAHSAQLLVGPSRNGGKACLRELCAVVAHEAQICLRKVLS